MKAEEKNRLEMEKLKRTKAINEAILWEQAVDVDEQRKDDGFSGVFFAIRSANISVV